MTPHEKKPSRNRPPAKTITVWLDADVLAWFKSQGRNYQRRINAVLRAHMDGLFGEHDG